jgi:hypothetical protein
MELTASDKLEIMELAARFEMALRQRGRRKLPRDVC